MTSTVDSLNNKDITSFFLSQISDVEQIMGLMHVEPVHIQAEAYDVAMDVSFPRGEQTCLSVCLSVCVCVATRPLHTELSTSIHLDYVLFIIRD